MKALQHVLEAYVLFDADASGTIDKEEVLHMVAEKGAKGGGNMASALLSEERWAELDWDKDGKITFVEFLYAFEAWVGVDDEDSDESDGDGADLILPTASSGAAAALALDAPSPESPQGAGATTTAAVGPANWIGGLANATRCSASALVDRDACGQSTLPRKRQCGAGVLGHCCS